MPDDLDLQRERARYTITVTFDTLDLYGKVVASREVIVEKESSPVQIEQ